MILVRMQMLFPFFFHSSMENAWSAFAFANGLNGLWYQMREFTKVLIIYTNEPRTSTIEMRRTVIKCALISNGFISVCRPMIMLSLRIIIGILLAASIIRNLHEV